MGNKRIWEIDFLRAGAIILMVVFHLVFDLNEFVGIKIDYLNGFWYWEGKISALIFIFLAGISSGFSKNNVKRGIIVLAFAMVVTLVTYILYKDQYIIFGILHFLAVCMLLYPLLQRINNIILLVMAAAIAFGAIPLKDIVTDNVYLLPLGITYKGFSTFDYYPLIPYLSVFILGILAYKTYYYKKLSLFKNYIENAFIRTVSKNSLAIYLIHQPMLIGMIYLTKI